jgi:hypothetical protein
MNEKIRELADEFKEENNDWNEDNLRHWGKQAATMLRQQQSDNEKLTADCVGLHSENEALKEKLCKAIYDEAAYCYDNGDYMLDYSDCQEIIRGTWVRPLYAGQENAAILKKAQEK